MIEIPEAEELREIRRKVEALAEHLGLKFIIHPVSWGKTWKLVPDSTQTFRGEETQKELDMIDCGIDPNYEKTTQPKRD